MVERLRQGRDFVRDALRQIPEMTVPEVDGAFYLFRASMGCGTPSNSAGGCSSMEKVGIAPGVAFGAGGEGSVRICYAADMSVLQPALERLARFVRRHPGPEF